MPKVSMKDLDEVVQKFQADGKKIVIFCENPNNDPDSPELLKTSGNIDFVFIEKAQAGTGMAFKNILKQLKK
jgi:predicted O-methyltransferase YrrM